jgi:hypothetical protein
MGYSFSYISSDRVVAATAMPQATNRTVYARFLWGGGGGAFSSVLTQQGTTGGSPSYEMYLQMENTDNAAFGFARSGGGLAQVTWTSGWTSGVEHALIGTYDGSNLRIYADTDATAKATQAETDTAVSTDAHVIIGNDLVLGNFSFGDPIYEVARFNEVISQASRLALGAGFSPLCLPEKPVWYFDLIRGAQCRMTGITGTVTGATVVPHTRIYYPAAARMVTRTPAAAAAARRRMLVGMGR